MTLTWLDLVGGETHTVDTKELQMDSSVGSEEADWWQVKMKSKGRNGVCRKSMQSASRCRSLDVIVCHRSAESQHLPVAGSQSACRRVNITAEPSSCNSHLSTAGLYTDQMLYGENSSEHLWSCFDGVLHREKPIFRKQTGCLAECEREKTEHCAERLHLLSLFCPRTRSKTVPDVSK